MEKRIKNGKYLDWRTKKGISNKFGREGEKELQSQLSKHYSEEDSGWLKCNTGLKKTSIFALRANDRNKSMEKDKGISGMWHIQGRWEEYRNSAPPLDFA